MWFRSRVVPETQRVESMNTAQLLLEAVKVLIWPLILVGVFFAFRDPLTATIQLIPEKLRESKKVSVGSLSFEIEERAARQGDARAVAGLRHLSEEAISLLLRSSGQTRLLSTNDENPGYLGLWKVDPISELVDAGLLHLFRSKKPRVYRDLSKVNFAELLAESNRDNPEPAIQELDKRGQKTIATELVRANSKDQLAWLLAFKWKKGEGEHQVLDQTVSADQRAALLELSYSLSPSGRALYEAMISVVSERLSNSQSDLTPSEDSSTAESAPTRVRGNMPNVGAKRQPHVQPSRQQSK